MKRILLLLVLFCTTIAQSQVKTFESEVRKISKKIEEITKQQKDSLKLKVIAIDKKLEKGEVSKSDAENQKKTAASYHARQIENLVGEQELFLQILVQDKTNGKIASADEEITTEDDENTFTIGNKTFRLNINKGSSEEEKDKRKKKSNRVTTSQFVFAMGLNNVLNNDDLSSLENSKYKFWQSHFYELGWTWKTRFTKEPSKLYFKYGVSFLWNNLRLKDNQQHVFDGNTTNLETRIDEVLTESRLRHVQMNFPVHLEWDFSKNKTYDNGFVKDRTNRSVRFGVGGFIGFKLGTRQYLEYTDLNGVEIEEVQYNNFNMNTLNYGLSSYIGYRDASFYVKYDLNPLFKNTDTRNISLGVRLDLN
ncbi:hypothetical protein [uncultured Polaribacter sp.]|uniref:hypothetical protein n=1 Tax=uncultured Polaribacter sp. TaxID=174711 RepID=UPI0026344B9A|nr:hypothetical protein [uncultured Polaribacter sp.]